MCSKETTIRNESGLHARPASEFVKCANGFESKVLIGRANGDTPVNAKSIVMLLALALCKGTQVIIRADGPDEQLAVDTLAALIDSGFSEGG